MEDGALRKPEDGEGHCVKRKVKRVGDTGFPRRRPYCCPRSQTPFIMREVTPFCFAELCPRKELALWKLNSEMNQGFCIVENDPK
jgi:hypothetical protein